MNPLADDDSTLPQDGTGPLTTRRQFMLAAGLATGQLLVGSRSNAATVAQVEVYASATSALPGGTLAFHLRDTAGSLSRSKKVPVSIVRLAYPQDVVMLSAKASVSNQPVPERAYEVGCNWPVGYTLKIGKKWPSGLYLARFGSDWGMSEVPFVVRAAKPGVVSRMMVQVQFTTMQAYNPWGGKSLYDYNSTDGIRSARVSMNRPMVLNIYENGADPWYPTFVRWLGKNGIAADFCSSLDLHADAGLLAPYQLFVTVGHDEYWSRDMRRHVDDFVWAGGNVISLSGNTCWWQIRTEPDSNGNADRTLVCYKSQLGDPLQDATLKTVNWIDLAPAWPENTTLGLGFTHGAIWTDAATRPPTPYVVQQPDHWLFANTGLGDKAAFGADIVGYETDAVDIDWDANGRPYPTGNDGAPRNLKVLAVADASTWAQEARALGLDAQSGMAAIGIYTQGGTVLAVGSTDWVHGLQPEMRGETPSPVSQITWNAVQRLLLPYAETTTQTVDVMQYHIAQASGDGSRSFLTTSAFVDTSWTFDRIAFRSLAASVAGAVPVYQYHADQFDGDGQRYYYALSAEIGNGWILDGVAFYAWADAQLESVPVYQYHAVQANGDGWRFFFSTDVSEGDGWVQDAPVFYVPA